MAWSTADINNLIQNDAPDILVRVAQELGEQLVRQQMTTNQIRNIFGEARKIQANWRIGSDGSIASRRTELILLKPKMAYQAARHPSVKTLKDCLTTAIDAVTAGSPSETEQLRRFRNFMNFFEAIVAYHKEYGGKD